jgi:hypothetical protein
MDSWPSGISRDEGSVGICSGVSILRGDSEDDLQKRWAGRELPNGGSKETQSAMADTMACHVDPAVRRILPMCLPIAKLSTPSTHRTSLSPPE